MSDVMRVAEEIAARMLVVQEACATVALSHEEHCDCLVCQAAHGSYRALIAVCDLVDA